MMRTYLAVMLLLVVSCNEKPKPKDDRDVEGKGLIEGNGGSGPSYKTNPWFLGNEPVEYCIRRDANFSVSEDELKGLTAEVITGWLDIVDKIIDEEDRAVLQERGITYAKTFNYVDACRDDI